jgi:WD40 repeat protein
MGNMLCSKSLLSEDSYLVDMEHQVFYPLTNLQTVDSWNIWSPDCGYFVAVDVNQNLVLVASETLVEIPLDIQYRDNYFYYDMWQWEQDHHLIIYDETPDPDMFYIFDMETLQFKELEFEGNYYGTDVSFSNDLTQLAYVDDGAVVYNFETEQKLELKPHSGAFITATGGEIIWNRDSEWLIIADEALGSSGAHGLRWINVANKTGEVNRELIYCAVMSLVCVDWLPKQVDITKLPQPNPLPILPSSIEPDIILKRDDWAYEIYMSRNPSIFTIDGEPYIFTDALTPEGETPVVTYSNDETEHLRIGQTHPYTQIIDKVTDEVLLEMPWAYPYAISPDETLVALATLEETREIIEIWSVPEKRKLTTIYRGASSLAFSPDSKYLAAGVSWEVWIWETADFYQEE